MRQVLIFVAATAVAVAILVGLRDHGSPVERPRPVAAAPGSRTADSVIPTTSIPTTPAPSTTRTPPPTYRTGTALGRPVRTDYGTVQVRVTTRAGRIAAVVAVQLPHEVPMDVELSRTAVRQLTPAVIAAQSAGVDVVSGATYTSDGYLRSLQSALDMLR